MQLLEAIKYYHPRSTEGVLSFLGQGKLQIPPRFTRELPEHVRSGVLRIRDEYLAVVGIEKGNIFDQVMNGVSVAFDSNVGPDVCVPPLEVLIAPRGRLKNNGNLIYPFPPYQDAADHLADLVVTFLSPGPQVPYFDMAKAMENL